jgi:glycerophosphoryl diester phosphodiesterase
MAVALLVVPALIPPAAVANVAEPCPMIVGHRADEGPENTVAGIQLTAATGVPVVEVDVRYTASGYPYLLHDETLDRTTTGTGPIASRWVSEMGAFNAADYAPWASMRDSAGNLIYAGTLPNGKARTEVPFTADWLKAIKDAGVTGLLDAKVTPTKAQADILMSYVNRPDINIAPQLIYMGSASNVQTMRGWYPALRYAVIEYPPTGRVYTPDYLLSIGAGAYVVPWDRITAGLVAYHQAAGLEVYTWTSDQPSYDTPTRWLAVAAAGVDAVITNEPAAALATLCPAAPTATPSTAPTSASPATTAPTTAPTTQPTMAPTTEPTGQPSLDPTAEPSEED